MIIEQEQISTLIGPIPRKDLLEQHVPSEDDDAVYAATEWFYMGDDPQFKSHVGKLVRRDAAVILKRGLAATGEQGEM